MNSSFSFHICLYWRVDIWVIYFTTGKMNQTSKTALLYSSCCSSSYISSYSSSVSKLDSVICEEGWDESILYVYHLCIRLVHRVAVGRMWIRGVELAQVERVCMNKWVDRLCWWKESVIWKMGLLVICEQKWEWKVGSERTIKIREVLMDESECFRRNMRESSRTAET